MLEKWESKIVFCGKESYISKYDIGTYETYEKEYHMLNDSEKAQYKGAADYIRKVKGIELTTQNINYHKLLREVGEKIASGERFEKLVIDYIMQEDSVIDLLKSFEDVNYIKSIYKKKKSNVSSGLNTGDANKIVECIKQGSGLLQAGQSANMLVKPLIDYYAASVYAYAIIVLNSPLHKSIDSLKGSHGHVYNHENGTIDFGGNVPRGTFIDLLCAISLNQIDEGNISIRYSLIDSIDLVQKNNISISINALLSMIPELNDYYSNVDLNHCCIFPLRIDTSIANSRVVYNFYIGDGEKTPNRSKLALAFKTENIKEISGAYIVAVNDDMINNIIPMIYRDIRGKLWYVQSPVDGLCLPEICLHFLIMSGLCNVMRYSPHQWSQIMNNKPSPQFSLLINRYIRLFEQKYPMLIAQYLSQYYIIMKS